MTVNVLLSSTDFDHLRHFLERLLQLPFTVIPFSRRLFEKVAQKCQPSGALAKLLMQKG